MTARQKEILNLYAMRFSQANDHERCAELLEAFVLEYNRNVQPDIGILRDCWSIACAVGYLEYPSLEKIQNEFEKWLDENRIDWR